MRSPPVARRAPRHRVGVRRGARTATGYSGSFVPQAGAGSALPQAGAGSAEPQAGAAAGSAEPQAVPQAGAGSAEPQAGAPTTSFKLLMSVSFLFATPPYRASIMHFQETHGKAEEGTNLLGTHLLVSTRAAQERENPCSQRTNCRPAPLPPRSCSSATNGKSSSSSSSWTGRSASASCAARWGA